MNKMIKEVLKDSLLFFGLIAILDIIVSMVIYNELCNSEEKISLSIVQVFSLLFTNQEQGLFIRNSLVDAVLVVEKMIEIVFLAILTGFIFSRVINRELFLRLHDTLVLKRRTSERSNGKLALSVIVGNPKKYHVYNMSCILGVRSGNDKNNDRGYNAEVFLQPDAPQVLKLNNYYTFTFPAEDIPVSIWKHYLNENGYWYDKDNITVYLSGETGNTGGQFRIVKEYHLKDLRIDSSLLNPRFKKRDNIIDWKLFDKPSGELTESYKDDVIEEIHKLAED